MSYPENSSGGYPAGYWEGNPDDCLPGYPENRRESYLPGNLENCWESYRDSYSAGSSPNRSEDSSEDNPGSNLPDCWADSPENRSEGRSVDRLPGNLAGSVPNSTRRLLGQDDLANGLRLEACGLWLFSYEVHSRRQRPHIIRARLQVQHLSPADVQQVRPVSCILSTVYCAQH